MAEKVVIYEKVNFQGGSKKLGDGNYDIRELESIIDAKIQKAIRKHELVVAFISSLLGFILIAGLFHAIWLNHTQIKHF